MELPQKKGIMYVYKLATGHQKPVIDPAEKAKKSTSQGIWPLGKSKKCREKDQMTKEEEKDGKNKVFEGRKSFSLNMEGRKLYALNIEGRKSASHIEAPNLWAVANFLQVKVLVSDMPVVMQIQAYRCARRTCESLEKFSSKHIAYSMKKEFDKVYGPSWHCIVGSSFSSFVTHAIGCFLYFSIDKIYILIFKTKVQKALD